MGAAVDLTRAIPPEMIKAPAFRQGLLFSLSGAGLTLLLRAPGFEPQMPRGRGQNMSVDKTGGYISDISYVAEFYGDHAPAHMNLVAAGSGFRPRPIDGAFTWCDYGCGNGITAVVLAGCFPHAQFYGVDFMPAHIRMAETLAHPGRPRQHHLPAEKLRRA